MSAGAKVGAPETSSTPRAIEIGRGELPWLVGALATPHWGAAVAESYLAAGNLESMHEHLDLAMELAPDGPELKARVSFPRESAP